MTERTMADAWATVERDTGLHRLPPMLRRDLRRAFYLGAQMFVRMTFATATESAEPDEQFVDTILAELDAFDVAMRGGEA